MREYRDYQESIKDVSAKAGESSLLEDYAPAAFLLVGVFISAAATYYLNEVGLRNSPLYARTIGSQNAAILVLAILEGSFLALTLGGFAILKTLPQRVAGSRARVALKAVLSANILAAFVMLAGYHSALLPMVSAYAQWGVPLTIVGAIWFWAYVVAHRRTTLLRDSVLDVQAIAQREWADQYVEDQRAYRSAYQTIVQAPEFEGLRASIATRQAVAEISRASGLPTDEVTAIYEDKTGKPLRLTGAGGRKMGYTASGGETGGKP